MHAEQLIVEAAAALCAAGVENGRQEARWLLQQALGVADTMPPPCAGDMPTELERRFREAVRRRLKGEPLQYVMGNVAFHCVELSVGPGVLIPRPETERLVDFALEVYPGQGAICDVCTGSGAIALALAKSLPATEIVGIDLSREALAWALRNQADLKLENTAFLQGDLFEPLPEGKRFAMITANPPYVSEGDYASLEPVIRDYEPSMALLAGPDGLDLLRRIVHEAPPHLAAGGWLLCEIGDEQGPAMERLLRAAGYVQVAIRQDYAGKDRVAMGRLPLTDEACGAPIGKY